MATSSVYLQGSTSVLSHPTLFISLCTCRSASLVKCTSLVCSVLLLCDPLSPYGPCDRFGRHPSPCRFVGFSDFCSGVVCFSSRTGTSRSILSFLPHNFAHLFRQKYSQTFCLSEKTILVDLKPRREFWQDVPFFEATISPATFTFFMQGWIILTLTITAFENGGMTLFQHFQNPPA